MLLDLLLVCVGLALLLGGGDLLVRGASNLASRLGVSPLVVGLTVVAFGTSAPELAVNMAASINGNPDICFGNIVGSNMANIGLIAAVTALVRPIPVQTVVVAREIPMMLLATLAAIIMASDFVLRGEPNRFDRAEGLVLLLFFAIFIFYNIHDIVRKRNAVPEDGELRLPMTAGGLARDSAFLVAGLAALVFGGKVTVDASVSVATRLELPESLIGLTLVAVGTSLPELATSMIAAMKRQSDLAIGNVVGSNIFNLLFVMGIVASSSEVPVPDGGMWDLGVSAVLSMILLTFTVTHSRQVLRGEAGFLLLAYLAYVAWRFQSI